MPCSYRHTHVLVTWVDLLSYCKIQYFAINTEQVYSKTIKYMVISVSSCDKTSVFFTLTAGTSNYDLQRRVTKALVEITVQIFN